LACSSDGAIARKPAPAPSDSVAEPETNTPAPAASASTSPRTSPPATTPEPETPRIDLHDPELIPQFELTLDAAAIATLSSPGQAQKTWVHGSFRFGKITFADVGVRAKGSESYRPLPGKASLKIKFNKFVKGQKLHGLKELTLNNSVDDHNYLRQRLTYHVFRSMGLPAPKANSAQLRINGEDFGLYTNVETPDEELLERVFGKNEIQTLYEAHTPGTWLPGSARRWEIDIQDPNAPVGMKPDLDRLFLAVASAKDETLLADLEPYLHTKQWLRYCATEAVTGLFDHYAYNKYGSHNYFMAGDASGKFILLPWSADDSMDQNAPIDASQPATNVVFARCKNSTACWSAYRTETASVVAVFETLRLTELARAWHDQIDALAKADPKRESTIERYIVETDALYEWLDARPAVIRSQLGL
jgi:spore coat protein CotH